MKNWTTHSRTTALDNGKFLKVEHHDVEFDEGHRVEEWPWVVTPDYISVVVRLENGDFLVFRQSKYAIEGDSWAIVGGYIEPGEDPLEAAKRELMEETGHEATSWTPLGCYVVDANRGFCKAYPFLATGARKVNEPDADDLEKYEILTMPKNELTQTLKEGGFKVLPWATAVALALPHLD